MEGMTPAMPVTRTYDRPFARVASRLAALCLVMVVAWIGIVQVGAGPAGAIGNGDFSIAPASSSQFGRTVFAPVLSAGVIDRDDVVVVNETAAPLKLHLYAADAYTSRSGGFIVQPPYKPKRLMGKWIHLPISTVTVAPKSGDVIPFSYHPPAGVPSGDYAGGIVAAQVNGQSVQQKGTERVRAVEAVGVAVYGRVRGPLTPRLAVTGVSVSTHGSFGSEFGGPVDATVTYSVTNTGNQNLKPTVTVHLSPLVGSGQSARRHLPQILPGSTVTFSRTFDSIVPFGHLTATVTATRIGVTSSGSGGSVVVPWGIVVVLVLLVALYVLRRRRRRRSGRLPGTDGTGRKPAAPVGAAQG